MHSPPSFSFVLPEGPEALAWLSGRKRVVAATGHRPNKWPARETTVLAGVPGATAYDPFGLYTQSGWALACRFAREVLAEQTPDGVIAGGALGWDMVVAAAALQLRVPLMIAVPFERQASRWPAGTAGRAKWAEHLGKADVAVAVTPGDRALSFPEVQAAMAARNRFMTQHAQVMLALHDGSPGGTGNCLRDCHRAGRTVVPCWQRFRAFISA